MAQITEERIKKAFKEIEEWRAGRYRFDIYGELEETDCTDMINCDQPFLDDWF